MSMKSEVDNLSSRISGEELKKELIALTRDLGFDSCRVTACAPPPHVTQFQDWLRQGSAGEMSYMQRGEEKRCDPQKVLPGARSVIVVALNYFQGDVAPAPSQGFGVAGRAAAVEGATGRIARYAWGNDYHDVVAANLHRSANFLSRLGGRQSGDADTRPV